MSFYLLKPCRGKAAFEAVPKGEYRLDMEVCRNELEARGYVVTDAGVMLVAARGGFQVSIYPSGRLLIQTEMEKDAVKAANGIYGILGLGDGI